jgi:hypothetical protein
MSQERRPPAKVFILSKIRKPEREAAWVKLANDLEKALGRPVRPPPEGPPNPATGWKL